MFASFFHSVALTLLFVFFVYPLRLVSSLTFDLLLSTRLLPLYFSSFVSFVQPFFLQEQNFISCFLIESSVCIHFTPNQFPLGLITHTRSPFEKKNKKKKWSFTQYSSGWQARGLLSPLLHRTAPPCPPTYTSPTLQARYRSSVGSSSLLRKWIPKFHPRKMLICWHHPTPLSRASANRKKKRKRGMSTSAMKRTSHKNRVEDREASYLLRGSILRERL